MPDHSYYHNRRQLLSILVLAFSIIWSGLANAAVTVDNVSTEFDNNPDALTTSHATSGADRLMIVSVSMLNDDFETVASVTYDGVGLNFVGAVAQDDDSRVELWSYLNPPITTADVTVTFDDRVQDGAGIGIITFTGVDQASPFGAFQSQADESSAPSINVTSATGELVLGVMAAERQGDSPSTTLGTQQWSYKVQNGNNKTVGAGATRSGSASTTLTWGLNETDDWAVGAISIRPSGVTPPILCGSGTLNAVGLGISGGSDSQINTTTEALAIHAAWLAAGSPASGPIDSGTYNVTASGLSTVDRIDFGGSGHDFAGTLPYPGDSAGVNGTDFLVHTSGTLSLPAGDYTIYVEADDGFSFNMETLSGETVSFNKFGSSTAGASNELRFENPTGNSNTGGSFTLSQDSVFDIAAIFFERGGGDYLEISIANNIRTNSAPSGYEILRDGALNDKVKFGQCAPPTPLLEYRFDETRWNGTANEVADSSGNNNHAQANAASDLTTFNPGQVCRAGQFDGTDDYIESSSIFSYLRTTASLSFWIKTTQTGNNTGWKAPGIAGAEQSGGADDIFWGWLDASGRIGISVANDFTSKSTVAINNGVYHHVVLTRDSPTGAYKIYIDGALNNSGTIGTGDIGTNFSSIGRIEDTGGSPEYLQGDLDELILFDNILSDAQVSTIYTEQLAGNNFDGSVRSCPTSVIDHYVISQTGNGISCEPYSVTVSAVDSAGAGVDIPAGTVLTLSTDIANNGWSNPAGAGATYTLPADSTSVGFQLRQLTPATLEIDVDDSSGNTDDDGNRNDDNVVFSDAGFVFYANGASNGIGTQISGKRSNISPGVQSLTVKAVKSSATDPGVCEALISNASANIGIAYQCVNPNSCATSNDALTINTTTIDANTVSPYTAVSLLFDSTGEATFTLNYADAGSIALSANADLAVSGSNGAGTANVQGDSNAFVVKPAGLCVQVMVANSDCASGDASCSKYLAAGIDFDLEISGRAWVNNTEQNTDFCNNAVTPNFVHSGIALSSNLVAPGGGANAVLSVTSTATGTSGTVAQPLNVDEVGVFTFTATAPTYLTETIAASTSANVGRFTPDHFAITSPVNNGTLDASCSGNFSYIGQDFGYLIAPSFIIEAQNKSNSPTLNYQGNNWAKIVNGGVYVVSTVTEDETQVGTDLVTKLSIYHELPTNRINISDNSNGTFNASFGADIFCYGSNDSVNNGGCDKVVTSQVAPFNSDIKITLSSIADSDITTLFTQDFSPTASQQRFGRLSMDNTFGSELVGLTMPMYTEVFDGSNFVLNNGTLPLSGGDNCSVVNTADLDISRSLTAGTSNVTVSPSTANAGVFNLNLTAPGAGNTGSVLVRHLPTTVDSWLKYDWDSGVAFDDDPFATATFGIYKGNPVQIYIQQTYQQ